MAHNVKKRENRVDTEEQFYHNMGTENGGGLSYGQSGYGKNLKEFWNGPGGEGLQSYS